MYSALSTTEVPLCVFVFTAVCVCVCSCSLLCVCVCVCGHVYVVYEDTNLYNDIGITRRR